MVPAWLRFNAPFHVKAIRIAGFVLLVVLGLFIATTLPSCAHCPASSRAIDAERLRLHVETLSERYAPRDYRSIHNLDRCADYVSAGFRAAGADVSEQTFDVNGKTYRNIIGGFGPKASSRIIVGAHYDACGDTPGADDNASGVAGLIELAGLLGRAEPGKRIELVAYTLEEPPFFRTSAMGSVHHADQLRKDGVRIDAMISLEMIGCFSDENGSQRFPSILLKLFYPHAGNFIAVIGSYGDRKLIKTMKESMRGATDLPVQAMCASKRMPGIDFSDHLNYWNQGYTAVMVTDTAFMRNQRYHGPHDTMDTLDYERMGKVVLGVYEAVMRMSRTND